MKLTKIKSGIAIGLSVLAMFIASTSSTMCWAGMFEEVKMPKSLYKID